MAAPIAATPRPPDLPAGYEWDAVSGMYFDPKTQQSGLWTGATALPGTTSSSVVGAARKSLNREMAANLGVSGAIAAGQTLLSFVPTAQDVRNRQKLKELSALEAKGDLGLTGKERSQLDHELLDPVRALAGESRKREEEFAAASGNGDVGDLVRARRESQRRVDSAATQAGLAISRANLEKAAQQMAEIEQRTAYKSERAGQRLDSASRGLAEIGQLAGKVAAGNAQVQPVTAADLRAAYPQLANLDDATLDLWIRVNEKSPGFLNSKVRAATGTSALDDVLAGAVPPS